MVKHALRSVLVMSAAALFFSCGSGSTTTETKTGDQVPAPVLKSSSLVLSLSVSQPLQCFDAATVAGGTYHTIGLKEDGTVIAAGFDGFGQLNVSTWTGIKAVTGGANHTVGLKEDGTVVAVGANSYGQLNVSTWTGIKAVAAGAYHTVGLKEDGTVVAVGLDSYSQSNVSSWTTIKSVATVWYHTVGLKEDGTVVAVGANNYGQLNVSSWTGIKAVAAGWYHTVGLKEDGTVVALGANNNGQLNVSSWTGIKAVAAGANHTVGLKEDGTVVAVGANNNGQLNVSTWTGIKAVAAGANHTVGLKEDGTVVAVGANNYGQLNVSSWTNIMPMCKADVMQPITTSMLTGTLGNNGWYMSDVQITLTATDNEGGSGVKEIHYFVDGTETVVLGSSASYAIVSDGTHSVTWYAIDNAGNVETMPEEMLVNIDKTSPSIPALGVNSAILWPPNHKKVNIVLDGSVADSGSGIASAVITVTDEYGIYNMTVPGLGSVFQLEAWRRDSDMDGRLYTITVVITDHAGNQSTATTTVLVPHYLGKGSCKEQQDDERYHGGGHHKRGHGDRNHETDHDRYGHSDGRRHAADRDDSHHGGRI